MIELKIIKDIAVPSPSKIVMLIIDGLGGLPVPESGKTELEEANKTHLDKLAKEGICGLMEPIGPGITPGSGAGHLALFGYDPLVFTLGRGVLEALGIDFELKDTDIAARGNFCTVDDAGVIVDRRAGRLSTEENSRLCSLLAEIRLKDTQLFVLPVKEHRFLVVFRGDGLAAEISDTDPQRTGVTPNFSLALTPEAKHTAHLANEFVDMAAQVLSRHHPANMILFRGFSKLPQFPSMKEVFKLTPAAIVDYPMYKGLAKLLGMEILPLCGDIKDALKTLAEHFTNYDFFYIHVKKTDTAGEDGDFKRKVQFIEEIDEALPDLLRLEPEVVIITGDHSTPAVLRGHSWHPVPFLLYSRWCRPDEVKEFTESACVFGGLGRFPAVEVMPLAMANALKLTKFGA